MIVEIRNIDWNIVDAGSPGLDSFANEFDQNVFSPIILTFIVIASEIICTTDKVRVDNPVIRDHLQALSLGAQYKRLSPDNHSIFLSVYTQLSNQNSAP